MVNNSQAACLQLGAYAQPLYQTFFEIHLGSTRKSLPARVSSGFWAPTQEREAKKSHRAALMRLAEGILASQPPLGPVCRTIRSQGFMLPEQ